ncbi:DUF4123 domain-containing protein [Pseudomonas violetae]|jgi:hypothetical protein|uniref:DUF4123 domain-containing protein n=1 Tax=Pseudomonas violetae TaxID=2915813 RepID=A0ABT0F5N3_9PSED|nr:DUF4123 domain-containing protein [Pseudomonas violetae]MCK1793325.1 DUF4123 domain-containing protein [Pseudomonas violetae]
MSVPRPRWLLLDGSDAPQASAALADTFAHVSRSWLFEGTELHALREQGPTLVDLDDCPVLAERAHQEPRIWRGLLLYSEASTAQLLAHLRRMLTVSVGLHHRALLSYYSPYTASYFFDACDARELSRWLGPVRQLSWFGGTWADRAIGFEGWQQLSNPGLVTGPLAIQECLSQGQLDKLQTCLLEQHAWQWSETTGTDYERLWSHLQEGLALGFSERAVLDEWLWLRLQYPAYTPASTLPGLTPREHLECLRYLWKNNKP